MHLNQLLEEYRESDDKDGVFKEFTDRLWKSKFTFKKYKKYYTYEVKEGLLAERNDLIELFNKYSRVEYTVCKSFYNKKLDYIDYIRIHINNLYGHMFDKDVYYKGEYYKLLLTPKKEYFKTIKKLKNEEEINYDEISKMIEDSTTASKEIKMKSINRKLDMKFIEFKKLNNKYLRRIFDNYIPVHEYEEQHGWEMRVTKDGWSENNYIVKYFNKSLSGYLKDYHRETLGFKKRDKLKHCVVCGSLIRVAGKNHKMCEACWKIRQRELWRNNKRKIRNVQVFN